MKPKHFIELSGASVDELPPLLQSIRTEVEASLKAEGDDAPKAKVYFAIASTAALDRDDEVLIPKGVDTRDFEKNPVMLHIHNYRQVPAGRVHKLDVSAEAVGMSYSFAEGTAAGDELKHLYDNDYMRAFSVGFIPRGIVRVDDQTPNKIDVDLRMIGLYDCRKTGELRAVSKAGFFSDAAECRAPDSSGEMVELKDGDIYEVIESITTGKDGEETTEDNDHKFSIDLTKYERRPRAIIAKWELLEISPVPIGSNPEALLQRCVGGFLRKYQDDPAKLALAKSALSERMGDWISKLEQLAAEAEELDLRNAVPAHTTPIENEAEWNVEIARAQLARWASEDGSGNKELIDWGKFSQGFAWFDGANTNSFSGYKLQHHEVSEEKGLVANFAGVRSAMSSLLGQNVDVEGDDLAVYEHLARHYRDNGQDVPPFERDYSEDELKAVEEGTFDPDDEKGPVASHTTPIDNDAPWNGPTARGQLRRWASSDDSGNPDTIDYARFQRGFAWFDGENRETVGAYKLPHHVVRDGSLVAIWRGVTAAMGALLGARGGTDIPETERAGTYAHLAKHYRDNDREAPPLTRDYTEAEIKAITVDVLQFVKSENGEDVVDVDTGKDSGELSLDELHAGQWEDEVEERAVVTTGTAEGHTHQVDNMRTGVTSSADGHVHAYTAGAARTAPAGVGPHVHTVPTATGNTGDPELRGLIDTLSKRVEELEAEVSVRLGILHNVIEEMGDSILSAIADERGAGADSNDPAPGKTGTGKPAGGPASRSEEDQNDDAEAIERGTLALQDFLGTSGDSVH